MFVEATDEAGVDFEYTFGDESYENIMESSGGGVTVFDLDGDGHMDLYLLNGAYLEGISDSAGRRYSGATNRVYHNRGDGTFEDATERTGLADTNWSMAAVAVDYDADGDKDLYVLNYGPNVFFENNGDGTFTDVTDRIGLGGPDALHGFPAWSVDAAFWDVDGDGLMDVVTCNFLAFDPAIVDPVDSTRMPHPGQYRGQASLLYLQEPGNTFSEATAAAGLFRPDSKCMGMTVFDADQDGHLDLFQANDHQANFLFLSMGDGTFLERAAPAGVALNDEGLPTGSMDGTLGDVDGDGLVDVLVTDLRHGSLYRNKGGGLFEDVTRSSGLARAFDGKGAWGALLFDYDNDGDLDVFSANGAAETLSPQRPLLLENDGGGLFSDVSVHRGSYFSEEHSGRGAASIDFDNDGDLDLIISHVGRPSRAVLLRNDGGNRNHWIGLMLVPRGGLAAGVGARVVIEAGGERQALVNQPATSYLSFNDPRLHVGLGRHDRIDRLEVHWVGGGLDIYEDVPIDRYLQVVQGGPIQTR
ncbi:MAG: CRTAC1 family protein [Rhodothermales bacterium]